MQKWKVILLVAAIFVQSFYCPVMAREARFLETAAPVLDLSAKSAVVMEQESKETPAVSPSTENDKPQEPVGMPPQPVRQPLRVSIVNCSEKPQNGERAAEEVRSAGFTVVSTSTGSPVDHTQVLINASSSLAASRAQSLPFAYQLLRGSVSPATGDMIIYLGRDYEK